MEQEMLCLVRGHTAMEPLMLQLALRLPSIFFSAYLRLANYQVIAQVRDVVTLVMISTIRLQLTIAEDDIYTAL